MRLSSPKGLDGHFVIDVIREYFLFHSHGTTLLEEQREVIAPVRREDDIRFCRNELTDIGTIILGARRMIEFGHNFCGRADLGELLFKCGQSFLTEGVILGDNGDLLVAFLCNQLRPRHRIAGRCWRRSGKSFCCTSRRSCWPRPFRR